MTQAPSPLARVPASSSRKRWQVAGWWAGIVLLGIVVVWWSGKWRGEREVDRSQLVLKETPQGKALYWANKPDELFSGWMVEMYPSGQKKSRSQVVNGRLHGLSEGWYPDGMLEVQEYFAEGVAEGPVKKWYPDGTLRSEGVAQAGKLEGVFRRWHPNGVMAEEITLREGQPHGPARAWDVNGTLLKEVIMEAGEIVNSASAFTKQ